MAMERPRIPLPQGYPHDLSDDALAAAIRQMVDGWRGVSGSPDDLSGISGEVLLAFIQVGVQEQSRREVRAATRSARNTSYIAIGIALLAAVLSIAFGLVDFFGDRSWQNDQLHVLTQIRDLLGP